MSENLDQPILFDKEKLQQLREQVSGDVLVPGDPGYEEGCQVWDHAVFKQHPALIVLPLNVEDVRAAVLFARENDLPIGVQSGGHGHPVPANNALFINFKRMTGLKVDPAAATVRFEPGVLAMDLVKEAARYDLVPVGGFAASVGVTGLMLGSGIGWLARLYGSGPNSIRAVELVTAKGDILHVGANNNPELFWGMRGAGANFGVVTALECKLYPGKEFYGGGVTYPVAKAKEILAAYLKFTETVPRELTTALRFMHFPPVEQIPEPLRGKATVTLMGCYSGNLAAGEAALAPLRSLDTPIMDTFGVMAYSDIAKVANDPVQAPPVYVYSNAGGVTAFTDADIENLVAIAGNPESGVMLLEIRHLGGALADQNENDLAFVYPDPAYFMFIQATAPKRELLGKGRQAVETIMQNLKPSMPGKLMLNTIDSTEGLKLNRTMAAYPPNSFPRLRRLKDEYDPDNIFRFNNNIPPTVEK